MNEKRSECPISQCLEIWGDKWSLLIIRDLLLNNLFTYGDFLKSDEKIATNILASRLKTLSENGIIEKQPNPNNKLKSFYRLTEKGADLKPILAQMLLWADKHLEHNKKELAVKIRNTENF